MAIHTAATLKWIRIQHLLKPLFKYSKKILNGRVIIMVLPRPLPVVWPLFFAFSGVFSDTELARFGKLTQDIGELIHDDETFRLFTLVLLFSDVDNQPNLTRLRDSYLSIIRRRLSHLQDSNFQNYDDLAIGSLVYSKFSSCVAGIKELSFFVQKLLNRLKTA